jgi:chitin disaccharide deacetylase
VLTINADDWGGWKTATDAAKECCSLGRINSVSAMVFMEDSLRAAELSRGMGVSVGLHVNFTGTFDGPNCPAELLRHQNRVRRFLKSSKYAVLIFNPFRCRSFRLLFSAQYEEFLRLYGKPPTHFDGHQHMHLCSNMLLQRLMPPGYRVRRSFSFSAGDKSLANRKYRQWVDSRLAQDYRLTDYFFALSQNLQSQKFQKIKELSERADVEVMTHPEKKEEYEFLRNHDVLATLNVGGA